MKKEGTNKIDPTLGVIMTVKRSFPSSLNNEACGRYLSKEEMDKMEKMIAVHDFYPVVAKNKDTFDADMDKFAQDELEISRDEFDLLCGLLYLCKVSYFNLLNDVPCPTVCASSTVDNKLLVTATTANRGPTVTDTMIDCGELSHPECYCAGWIGNLLIFPPERLDAQGRTIKLAYSYVCNTPLITRIAYRFAGHDGKSAEEIELLIEAIRASCRKGGLICGCMRTEASNFIHMCTANDDMSREDAIELLRSVEPKLASLFEGSVKGGEKTAGMRTDASEFVREVVNSDVDMNREDAIELLRSIEPKLASLYEGSVEGGEKTAGMRTDASEFVRDIMSSDIDMNREDAIELLRSINTKLANLYEGSIRGGVNGAKSMHKLRRIAAGKDMTKYVWECCCGEKKPGYIDTLCMWCEECDTYRSTTNEYPDGELVWRLPAIHHDEQEKARQLSAQQPKAIAKAQKKATQVKKRKTELSTKYEGVQNANKMKPPPPPPKFN